MKISFVFMAALSIGAIGCKKKSSDAPDCAKAISNSMALSKAEMEKAPGMDAAMLQKMADIGLQRCKEDKWSADAVNCMINAPTMAGAQGCYGKLTKDQQDKMNKAAMEMAMGSHADTVGSGSAAAEGSGSATGSAGGSAEVGSAAAGSGSAAGSAESGSGSAGSAAAPK